MKPRRSQSTLTMADPSTNNVSEFSEIRKMFIWKDGIPHIGENCDLFVDRTFDIHVKSEFARVNTVRKSVNSGQT